MKVPVHLLFPYILHLHILQLEGYELARFLRWIVQNPFRRQIEGKKPLVWTNKVKLLLCYSLLLSVLTTVALYRLMGITGLLATLTINTQPWIFLCLATLLNKPREIINRRYTRYKIKKKIAALKKSGLKIIGITGSYGKTSTKEFLYQILSKKYKVLRTPESYNTLFGIQKVVDYELYPGYDFFIVEMGAYCRGEIKELCDTVLPDYGILTGINEQHLERFGNIENTIKAKFELIESLPEEKNALINIDSLNIKENYIKFTKHPRFYGFSANDFTVTDVKCNEIGSTFNLVFDGNILAAHTLLVGSTNISNSLAAASLAYLLGMKPAEIARALSNLKPNEHRLELKKLKNNNILIDDAYSSNITGFEEAIKLLSTYKGRTRILVTPGIIELGDISEQIHKNLGTKADSVTDYIYLVGVGSRTKSFSKGVNNQSKIEYLSTIKELFQKIESNEITNSVILLENDLPDNY